MIWCEGADSGPAAIETNQYRSDRAGGTRDARDDLVSLEFNFSGNQDVAVETLSLYFHSRPFIEVTKASIFKAGAVTEFHSVPVHEEHAISAWRIRASGNKPLQFVFILFVIAFLVMVLTVFAFAMMAPLMRMKCNILDVFNNHL